jgi:hypothetical protein
MKMKSHQVCYGSLLGALVLVSTLSGCGASGSSTTSTGGQAGVGGNQATGGAPDGTGGETAPNTEATGGESSTETGPSTGGRTATGGAPATGGKVATGGRTGTGGAPPIRCNSNVISAGCTPGQLTQTGTLNGRYGTYNATIGNKQYYLQVNEWGSSATQTMTYGGSSLFKITQQQASLASTGAPAGYPSAFIGSNSGHSTSNSGMPKRVGDLGTVLTTWNWNDNGTTADATANVYNAAYDVWFSTNAGGDSGSMPSGGFLMVWYYAQNCQPIGAIVDGGRTIDGVPGCWDVWTGDNNGKPVISYKVQGLVKSLGFDLNIFIKDALAHYPGYMNANWYLTNIFTGFEIWKGGVNLESTSFCAEVN